MNLNGMLLEMAVANFNDTIRALGPGIAVSHCDRDGREWEFEVNRDLCPPNALALLEHYLPVFFQAVANAPGRKVCLDRENKRLYVA